MPQQGWEKDQCSCSLVFCEAPHSLDSPSVEGQLGEAGHCGTGLTEDTGLLCGPCSSFCGEPGWFLQCSPSLELSHPSGWGCWSWGELSQALCAGTAPFRWGKMVKNASCQSLVSKNSRIISNTATRTNGRHSLLSCLIMWPLCWVLICPNYCKVLTSSAFWLSGTNCPMALQSLFFPVFPQPVLQPQKLTSIGCHS